MYNLEASSTAGDINITLSEKPKDAVITGQSAAGDVTIFNEENKDVTIGNGSKKISGKTAAGDVTIENAFIRNRMYENLSKYKKEDNYRI